MGYQTEATWRSIGWRRGERGGIMDSFAYLGRGSDPHTTIPTYLFISFTLSVLHCTTFLSPTWRRHSDGALGFSLVCIVITGSGWYCGPFYTCRCNQRKYCSCLFIAIIFVQAISQIRHFVIFPPFLCDNMSVIYYYMDLICSGKCGDGMFVSLCLHGSRAPRWRQFRCMS
ncbi:hypothetical protein BDN67DRAFT_370398 [Paxillus ammoniavirescens]|nr:hypothetical protein BDN67DRAFT_370398 [Paxillus ammoniavirescens]